MLARRTSHPRWIIWVTALVVLMAALAPSVSRWLASSSTGPLALQEVCASRDIGPSMIMLKYRAAPAGDHVLLDHCPLCVLQADHLGLPPAQLARLPAGGLRDKVPALFLHAPRPLAIWAAAQARAPPAVLA